MKTLIKPTKVEELTQQMIQGLCEPDRGTCDANHCSGRCFGRCTSQCSENNVNTLEDEDILF